MNKRRTIWMPDELWKKIKEKSGQEERRISSWIRAVLREKLSVLKGNAGE